MSADKPKKGERAEESAEYVAYQYSTRVSDKEKGDNANRPKNHQLALVRVDLMPQLLVLLLQLLMPLSLLIF